MADHIYVESTPTNCFIDGEHGQVTGIVHGPLRIPRAAFVYLDSGDMLHVVLGQAHDERGQWREVVVSRRIDRDDFDRLTEIDTLRHNMGWRP
jgi:hypothetical protein